MANQAAAQSKLQDWAELKEFHKVMAQTFHPSEEGNLEPIKTRIGEMVEKAKTLQASKFPADFDNEKIRKAVNQLVTDSQKLQADIKKGASDKKITKSLSGLHDVFHQIVGLCSENEHHDHDHSHAHAPDHGHDHGHAHGPGGHHHGPVDTGDWRYAVGLIVNLALVRELGPVVTALLFAGRAGTSLTAEIGLMKAGEQLSAMEMMAVDPVRRVLAPRFWAGVITLPLLAAVFSAVGIIGGWVVGVLMIGVDAGAFWSQMQGGVDVWADVGNGVIKSVVFGFAVTFIALLQGYLAQPTPEGVSRATTRTVVVASLAVLALDFILTATMFSI
mgnify:CR=1 FL=1